MLRSPPLSGCEILKELSRLTAGRFVPSPGTLYPLLSYLEPEGLITAQEVYVERHRKKIYELTRQGEEELSKLLKDEAFRELMLMLESGAASSDHWGRVGIYRRGGGGDEALLEEVSTPLKKLEEKVSARLAQL